MVYEFQFKSNYMIGKGRKLSSPSPPIPLPDQNTSTVVIVRAPPCRLCVVIGRRKSSRAERKAFVTR